MTDSELAPILGGKVAVVSGAGRGLGRVIATTLARSGARVVVCGRSRDSLDATVGEIRSFEGVADAVPVDLRDDDAVGRLRDHVLDRYGRVDVLVNNSGVAGPTAPLWEIEPDAWDETFGVNVRGVFLMCRAFLPAMIEQRGGSIITIGSMTGKRALVRRTPYAASKTALIGLTRTLAHEVGPHGIRVNLVSPGGVEGPRIEGVIAGIAEKEGIPLAAARAQFTDPSPLRRLVPPEDVASAVVFLASDHASSITGEDLNASAGVVMY